MKEMLLIDKLKKVTRRKLILYRNYKYQSDLKTNNRAREDQQTKTWTNNQLFL